MRHPATSRTAPPIGLRLLSVGLLSAGAAALGGCSSEDRSAVAAAKCAVPVYEEAGFGEDSFPRRDGVEVTDLGKGSYRVTGWASITEDGEIDTVQFVCEVEPDGADELRGFAVTRLEVTPAQ